MDVLLNIVLLYMLYYNVLSLWGYRNKSEKVRHYKPLTKFLVLIPAVNEASVISIPVKDVLKQKYPKELFSVVVIADHCTDNTAQIARQLGANVVETSDNPNFKRHGIGKANTLDYGLHQTNWHDYDYMIVFDSDNEVSSNFLQRMNDFAIEFCQPEAMQSALKSKKGHGFINNGLNLSFKRSHRFQQIIESKYGAASILGTGFATRIDLLEKRDGFRFKSLVEDEYEELDIISHDGQVKYVHDAYVINENYSEIKQACRGLTRWSKGSFECWYRFILLALQNVLKRPLKLKNWHVFARISTLSKAMQLIILVVLMVLKWTINYKETQIIMPDAYTAITSMLGITMTINTVFLETFAVLHEDHKFWQSVKIMFDSYVFSFFYQLLNIWAVLTFWKRKWTVSTHKA